MCVIAYVHKNRPSENMVNHMWRANSDGGGMAWIEGNEVVWAKNLDLDDMQERIATAPLPFVAHFRVASSGGVRPSLCHPFLVDRETASAALEGRTKGYVLFHNGDWGNWRAEAMLASARFAAPIPGGKWSDSRALAWLTSLYGIGAMEMIGEKTILFGPKDYHMTFGKDGWKDLNGIICSNDYFTYRGAPSYNSGRVCRYGQCTDAALPGSRYCEIHRNTEAHLTEEKKPEPVQVTGPAKAALGPGGPQTPSPFTQATRREVLSFLKGDRQVMTEGEAERLHKERVLNPQTGQPLVSKNELKRVRKFWEMAERIAKEEAAKELAQKMVVMGPKPESSPTVN
jgi:hypothetical protein